MAINTHNGDGNVEAFGIYAPHWVWVALGATPDWCGGRFRWDERAFAAAGAAIEIARAELKNGATDAAILTRAMRIRRREASIDRAVDAVQSLGDALRRGVPVRVSGEVTHELAHAIGHVLTTTCEEVES